MKLVVVESPYTGDRTRNLRYLRACMADCFERGEAPYASHGLYTQPFVLDDDKPEERRLGINAGFEWAKLATTRAVYTDLGISAGMEQGIAHASELGQTVEFRKLVRGSCKADDLGIGYEFEQIDGHRWVITEINDFGPGDAANIRAESLEELGRLSYFGQATVYFRGTTCCYTPRMRIGSHTMLAVPMLDWCCCECGRPA